MSHFAKKFFNEAKQIDNIVEQCKKQNGRFADQSFYPKCQPKEREDFFKDVKWAYADKYLKSDLFENITENSIAQGSLGDCYLLAALSDICAKGPEYVKKLFHPSSSIKYGVVVVYFYAFGTRVPVLIDTQLPFKIGTRESVFAHPNHTTDSYWFALVEKAYAKLKGSFTAIIGGSLGEAIYNMFGYVPEAMHLADMKGDIFQEMKDMMRGGAILGCSIHGGDKSIRELGLLPGHAYLIKALREADGMKFIKIRNPWGNHEWLGPYSDCSDKWTPKLKQELHYVDADDGTFWMNFDDFLKYYTDIDIARSKGKVGMLKGVEIPLTKESEAPKFVFESDQEFDIQFNTEIIGVDDVPYALKAVDGVKGGGLIMKTNQTIFSLTSHKLKFKSKKYALTVYTDAPVPKDATVFVRGVSPSPFTLLMNGKEIKEDPDLDIPEVTDDDDDGMLKKLIKGKVSNL